MDTGKLPPDILAKMLQKIPADPRVLVGPQVGEDAAVIDFGETLLVAKTDPITFATDQIGSYAVDVNANDIAVMGAEPRWFLATLLLPTSMTPDDAETIFDQMLSTLDRIGASLVGGHTEVTHGIDRPIVIGCMLGEAQKGGLVTTSGAQIGDSIMLTGQIALEGTSILAREASSQLRAVGVSEDTISSARKFIMEPGISVVHTTRIARSAGKINSMHDPTEGGLATGLRELASAANLGLDIDLDSVPVLPECREICSALKLDPMGLIASGSLLMTVSPADEERVLTALRAEGIPVAKIGKVKPAEFGIPGVPEFARDEIARFFDSLNSQEY